MTETQADFFKKYSPTVYSTCWPTSGTPPSTCGGPSGTVSTTTRQLCNTGSIYCNSIFCQNYCADPNIISATGGCPSLTTQIPAYCNTAAGFATTYCQGWCKNNPGQCNDGAKAYCDVNPTKQICSCLKSPMLGIQGLIPECHDATCRNYGYKTFTPNSVMPCPSYIDCKTSLQIKDVLGNVDLTNVTIEQNCGGGAGGGTTDVNVQPGAGTPEPQPSLLQNTADKFGISTTMLLIIVVGFILMIIAGMFLAFGGGFSLYDGGGFSLYDGGGFSLYDGGWQFKTSVEYNPQDAQ